MSSDLDAVLQLVRRERQRQDAKWGEQNHDALRWLAILGEEVGEANEAVLRGLETDQDPEEATRAFCEELAQVAAVAVATIQSVHRNQRGRQGTARAPSPRGAAPRWHSLAYWRDLDARIKTSLAERFRLPSMNQPTPEAEDAVLAAWLTKQIALALALPFLLTPIVMTVLFPGIPTPHPEAYYFCGVAGLAVSWIAREAERQKRTGKQTTPDGRPLQDEP